MHKRPPLPLYEPSIPQLRRTVRFLPPTKFQSTLISSSPIPPSLDSTHGGTPLMEAGSSKHWHQFSKVGGPWHNVKSDLIWWTYSPWWLYKAIAIKWGDLGRAGNFGRCLLGTYWGTPDGWHTLTQTNTNTFQYWALLAVKWWPLLPKYGHKSNKINRIELFSLQNPLHLFPRTQESIKPSKVLTSHFPGK